MLACANKLYSLHGKFLINKIQHEQQNAIHVHVGLNRHQNKYQIVMVF